MKKRRIVIASVLKPVDDTRMFEKMGMTLAGSGEYEVFIIGYPSIIIPAYANIHFLPVKAFARIGLSRWFASFKIGRIVRQVNPEILVVNTHELLIVALLNRILFGVKIVYDIRENYYRNILYSESFPGFMRPLVAGWVRLKEKLTSPLFQHFFLAENAYQKEMSFFGNRATVIENKALIPSGHVRTPVKGRIRLLFSGTLAESTGVFDAIGLAKGLHSIREGIQLTIIGSCHQPEVLSRIRYEIQGLSYIILRGGDKLVPHPEIVEAIFGSDFGIVCYPRSPHTVNSIPTKFYEYLAGRLPMILQDHAPWVELASRYQGCVPIDTHSVDFPRLLQQMEGPFYTIEPTGITWESEAEKVLAALRKI